jgi:bifunctional non-homologous end joining protein LigD
MPYDRLRGAVGPFSTPSTPDLDGRDLRPERLDLRRDLLAEIVADPLDGLAMSEAIDADGPAVFRHACALGLEGIISKRRSSPYRSGRDHAWRKIKCREYRRRDGSRVK